MMIESLIYLFLFIVYRKLDFLVEGKKQKRAFLWTFVSKTIPDDSPLVVYMHFLPKPLHDIVTLRLPQASNGFSDISCFECLPQQISVKFHKWTKILLFRQNGVANGSTCPVNPPPSPESTDSRTTSSTAPEEADIEANPDVATGSTDDLSLGESAAFAIGDVKEQPEREASPFSQYSSDGSCDLPVKPISKIRKTDKSIGK